MSEYILPAAMVISLLAGIFSGYRVAFLLGGLGILFSYIGNIPFRFLGVVVSRIYSNVVENWLLIAIPLFIYMGLMLERSGLANDLLESLERLFGRVRGGLAVSVAALGIIMAASTGIIGASVVMLGVMGLPLMLKKQYDPYLATGTVIASSTLGILIPPSIMLVLVGDILQLSVGDLFLAAIFPGLILGGLYILYILAVGFIFPERAPAAPVDDHVRGFSLFFQLLRDLFAPVFLLLAVLGSIAVGIATPTEAAALGALGITLLAVLTGRFRFRDFRESVFETSKLTSLIVFVLIGATCFSVVFKRLGGERMIEDAVFHLALGPYGTLALLMLTIFILGFFLEWLEISFIVLPLFAPIMLALDFGPGLTGTEVLLWFAVLVAINLQTSFLTPPFGYALFFLKSVAPAGITLPVIYRSIIPFVVLQLIGLTIAVLFPQVILWLPGQILGN